MMFFLEERNLERQDGKQFSHITLDVLDAVFLPGPKLGRYVIISRYVCIGFQELSNIQVKPGIVDQNHHIGLPPNNVFFAHFHVLEDGSQVQQHGDKTHVRHFLEMPHPLSPNRRHEVSAEESKLSVIVLFFQSRHQVRGMQVSTGFANNQIILHKLMILEYSMVRTLVNMQCSASGERFKKPTWISLGR